MSNFFRVITFLLRASGDVPRVRATFGLIIFFGVVGGFANTALLGVINETLSRGGVPTQWLLWGFGTLCLVMPATRLVSELLILRLSQKAIFTIRLQICRRILRAPLRHLEELGSHRLLASLTDDVAAITTALVNIPLLLMNATVVTGCLIYMAYLSRLGLGVVLAFMVVGVVSYQWPFRVAAGYFERSRLSWNEVFKGLRALTEGIKELKLHRHRRQEFLRENLEAATLSLQKHAFTGNAYTSAAGSWGQVIFFMLIGVVIFVLPQVQDLDSRVLTGFALTILYMVTPMEGIMNMAPSFTQARVAVDQVEQLGTSLVEGVDREIEAEVDPEPHWESLELDQVAHTYWREGEEESFTLGPLDLTFQPGQLVFLVGGNGSGKTTLAKLIMGLYAPEKGVLKLDGEPITDENRDRFRQLFAVVFTNFFLFDRLIGLGREGLDTEAETYLEKLQLQNKVTVQDGNLSTIDLSQGQRKRLALLTAFLEDRPIYLFDEWAADQDPYFKKIFYYEILPELKARNKTVIVISHDDHYYDVGDRIVKLDYGQIEHDRELPRAGQPADR